MMMKSEIYFIREKSNFIHFNFDVAHTFLLKFVYVSSYGQDMFRRDIRTYVTNMG